MRLVTALVSALVIGGCVETAAILLVSAPSPVAYDHGEGFDARVLDGITPRQPPSFPHAFVVMPARAAVERGMVWVETNPADRHRPAQLDRRGVRQLTEKVFGKYRLFAAMIERRGLAQDVEVVEPGMRVVATTADLRVYIQAPVTRPTRPELPEAPHGKRIVASTVIGVDKYQLFTGYSSAEVREDPAIHDFKERVLDALSRLEATADQLQASPSRATTAHGQR